MRPILWLVLVCIASLGCILPKTTTNTPPPTQEMRAPTAAPARVEPEQPSPSLDEPRDIELVEHRTDASALEFMEAICPGAAGTVEFQGRVRAVCTSCPEQARGDDPNLHASRIVTFGEDIAVVSTSGCGGGFELEDSTALLERRGATGWKMSSFTPFQNTESCRWLGATPPLAVCTFEESGRGSSYTYVYSMTLREGALASGELTEFADTEDACVFDGEFSAKIDEMLIEDIDADGNIELVVLLSTKTGVKTGKARPRHITNACDDIELGVVDVVDGRRALIWRLEGGSFTSVEVTDFDPLDSRILRFIEADPQALD